MLKYSFCNITYHVILYRPKLTVKTFIVVLFYCNYEFAVKMNKHTLKTSKKKTNIVLLYMNVYSLIISSLKSLQY